MRRENFESCWKGRKKRQTAVHDSPPADNHVSKAKRWRKGREESADAPYGSSSTLTFRFATQTTSSSSSSASLASSSSPQG